MERRGLHSTVLRHALSVPLHHLRACYSRPGAAWYLPIRAPLEAKPNSGLHAKLELTAAELKGIVLGRPHVLGVSFPGAMPAHHV